MKNPYNPDTEPASWKWFNEKPAPEIKEDDNSPYCKLCESCGEDGCCSWVNCFRKLSDNNECDYGGTYVNDAMFANEMQEVSALIFARLGTGLIDGLEAVTEYNKRWHEVYDEIYK